jgi:D-tagatose-1,6-bisphosphate aldolase subunit GatZ/KbaZ
VSGAGGAVELFRRIVEAQKSGTPAGVVSICSAHPVVLRAAMEQAQEDGLPLLVESTVNQVNQFGGYTGLRPADFAAFLGGIRAGFPAVEVLLGADHLGPYPWRGEPAAQAMQKARALAADCVRAGYVKLHLDASMPLGGDAPGPRRGLDPGLVARREAELAAAAEDAFRARSREDPAAGQPVYVIGTDVPPPGGIVAGGGGVPVTTVEELRGTVELCGKAFDAPGLRDAWSRVRAVVVQPGVEFGDRDVQPYDRARAAGLCAAARDLPGLVLEGHSTDYQDAAALRALVEDGVAVLKVGPALTFAMREALFALEHVERELATGNPSGLGEALEQAMLADPPHWSAYYRGEERELALARRFSLLDRCRYYWTVPAVQQAVERLLANLRGRPIPWTLASQYLPRQAGRARELPTEPLELVRDAVREVLRDYAAAVRPALR